MTSSNRTTGFFIDPFEELALQGALCRLSFWWLECDTWELRARPIYGQVIPTRSATPLQWVPREVGKRASLDGSKKRIVTRRSIVLPGLKIHGLLALLHTGLSLTDACQQLELPEIDVRLGGPWMNAEWDRLPAAFFSSVPSQSLLSPFAQGRTSVVPYAGCVCSRFAPQNRFKFLEDEQQSDEVLRWVAGLLRSETGIDFSGSAGDAFGCLEVFSFPSLDLRERSRVEVDYEKSADGTCCNVRLALTGAIAHADYIAQVRSEQVLSIASDQLVFFDESGLAAVNVPEPVDGVLVRVWRRTEGTWMLWDEIEQHFLRSIGIQGSLINLTGTVGASWLERLPPRLNPRAQKFSAISQVGMNLPMDISNRLSWGQGIQSARQVVRRMNPAPSGARFFQRGWGTDENKFEFAEWLKEQLSKCSGTIVVADPYFDLLGLDLICRASGAAKELVVVTNTQIKSLDDNGVTSRAERLREGAKQNLELLRGLNLRICDLQSRGGGNKQHLHDRYVLFYDQEDRPESGFHLSTSLQSAAATSPLLATPIPLDVVPAVAGYVAELLKPEEDTYDVVTLFPPDVTRATARRQGLSDTEAQSVLKLIEVAQGRTDLVHSSGTDRLRELGAFDGEKVRLEIADDQLERIGTLLATGQLDESSVVWVGLVKASLAGWHRDVPERLVTLCLSDVRIGDFLVAYLVGHATGEIRAEHAEEHTRTLAHVLELPFSQAVHEAARFYDHHHRLPLGTSWSIHLALVCLIAHFPATIDDFVQRLKEREEHARGVLSKQHSAIKPSAEDLKAAVATVTGVPAVLSAFVAALTCFANQPDLALPLAASSSRLAFARALYGIAAWRTLGDEPAQWEEFGKCLSRYGVTEQQELLGMALYDLRVKANQERHRGLPESSRVRPLVVEALVASLSSTSSVERLVELMPFFSGPLLGSSSASTHKEILVPLVTSGTLSEHDLFEVWDKLIGKRLTDDYLSHADVELVQVWGATYWKATQTRQLDVLAEATKALEASGRSLSEPFLRSRDSARWQGAARRALWWLFRLWAIFEKSARDVTRAQLQAQVHELLHRALQLADDEALVESAVGETREFATNVLARLRSESLIVRPASEESRPSTDGSEPSTE